MTTSHSATLAPPHLEPALEKTPLERYVAPAKPSLVAETVTRVAF